MRSGAEAQQGRQGQGRPMEQEAQRQQRKAMLAPRPVVRRSLQLVKAA
jgi:hypothetical protein